MQALRYLQIITLVILSSVYGCKDPELVGLGTLADADGFGLEQVDTFSIVGSYGLIDSLPTSNLPSAVYLLGGMNDPVFGKVSSTLYSQFRLGSSNIEIADNPVIDSVVVYLKYYGSYGALDRLKGYQQMKVFELAEDIADTATYYQETTHQTGIDELASFGYWKGGASTVVAPKGSSSVGDTLELEPHLRIKLSDSYGENIISSGSATLENTEEFVKVFKGLVFEPQVDMLDEGNGAIYYYDVADGQTRMRVYYHTSDGSSVEYDILDLFVGTEAATHTSFYHDFPAQLLQDTGNVVVGEQTLLVQAVGGIRSRIEFPGLNNLTKEIIGGDTIDASIAINKAELIFPIEGGNYADFAPPIGLFIITDSSQVDIPGLLPGSVIDVLEGDEYFGGTFDWSAQEYRFNIARQVQWFLNNDIENPRLYVYSTGNATTAYRGVLNGTNHPLRPIKLRVTFTRID